MLALTLDLARARDIRRAELIVRADNAPAISLYRRFGFEVEGLCRQYMSIDGTDHDALLMARLLGAPTAQVGG
jgi:ribosomal protein S18 acetylase RimI-like enzyme